MENATSTHPVKTSSTVESLERVVHLSSFFNDISKCNLWPEVKRMLLSISGNPTLLENYPNGFLYKKFKDIIEWLISRDSRVNKSWRRKPIGSFKMQIKTFCSRILEFFSEFYWNENELSKYFNKLFKTDFGGPLKVPKICDGSGIAEICRLIDNYQMKCKAHRLRDFELLDCSSCNPFIENPMCTQINEEVWVTKRFLNKLRILSIPYEKIELNEVDFRKDFHTSDKETVNPLFYANYKYLPKKTLGFDQIGVLTLFSKGKLMEVSVNEINYKECSQLIRMFEDYSKADKIDRQVGPIEEIYKAGNHNFAFVHSPSLKHLTDNLWCTPDSRRVDKIKIREVIDIDLLYGFKMFEIDCGNDKENEFKIQYDFLSKLGKKAMSSAYGLNMYYGVDKESAIYNTEIMFSRSVISCSMIKGLKCAATKKMISDYGIMMERMGNKGFMKYRYEVKKESEFLDDLKDSALKFILKEELPKKEKEKEREEEKGKVEEKKKEEEEKEEGEKRRSNNDMEIEHPMNKLIKMVKEGLGDVEVPAKNFRDKNDATETRNYKKARNKVSSLERKNKNKEEELKTARMNLQVADEILKQVRKEVGNYKEFTEKVIEIMVVAKNELIIEKATINKPKEKNEESEVLRLIAESKGAFWLGVKERIIVEKSRLKEARKTQQNNKRSAKSIKESIRKKINNTFRIKERQKIEYLMKSLKVSIKQYTESKYYGTKGDGVKNSTRKIILKEIDDWVKNAKTSPDKMKDKNKNKNKSQNKSFFKNLNYEEYKLIVLIYQTIPYESEEMDFFKKALSKDICLKNSLSKYMAVLAGEEEIAETYAEYLKQSASPRSKIIEE